MKGLFIKSLDNLISLATAYSDKIELGVISFISMRIDYIFIGPPIGFNHLSKVIFLSDKRYYYQTYAKNLFYSINTLTSEITLDNMRFKGIIYSSEV